MCLYRSHTNYFAVVKEPPYQVAESGYGSFMLPVEVYFRNKDEPKKVRFEYDLLLPNLNDPPISQIRSECLTFQNPSEEFRQKLVKSGGIISGGPPVAPEKKPQVGSAGMQKKRPGGELDSEIPKKKKKLEGGKQKGERKKKKAGSSSSESSDSDSSSESESGGDEGIVSSKKSSSKKQTSNTWNTTELKRLHKQLNSLQDPQQLQDIVNIIEQTGLYNLTASTFDFDLCKLDNDTLDKLRKFVEPTS